jgi:hypothetical protein
MARTWESLIPDHSTGEIMAQTPNTRSKNGKTLYVQRVGLWIDKTGSVSIAHANHPKFHLHVTQDSKQHARLVAAIRRRSR